MRKIFVPLLALLFASCQDNYDLQKYNDTVVLTYNAYMKAMGDNLSSIGDSKAATDAAVAYLTPLTDSCLNIMRQTQPNEKSKDFHQKITAVYQEVKSEILPIATELGNLQDSAHTAQNNPALYQETIQRFNKANQNLTALKEAAKAAQKSYAEQNNIKIQY